MRTRIPGFMKIMLWWLLALPSCSTPVPTPPEEKAAVNPPAPETQTLAPAGAEGAPAQLKPDEDPFAAPATKPGEDPFAAPAAKPEQSKPRPDALDDLFGPVEKPAPEGARPKAKPADAADPFS